MLILTRRIGESIIINGDIDVEVLNIERKQVKLGINAPKEISVHREEIWRKIQEEKNQKEVGEEW